MFEFSFLVFSSSFSSIGEWRSFILLRECASVKLAVNIEGDKDKNQDVVVDVVLESIPERERERKKRKKRLKRKQGS